MKKSATYTQEDIKRTVIEENDNIAWKVDDKFIMPNQFLTMFGLSGDRYETFFDEYIEKLDTSALERLFDFKFHRRNWKIFK